MPVRRLTELSSIFFFFLISGHLEDVRIDDLHGYKFIATLQHDAAHGSGIQLLKAIQGDGHEIGKSIDVQCVAPEAYHLRILTNVSLQDWRGSRQTWIYCTVPTTRMHAEIGHGHNVVSTACIRTMWWGKKVVSLKQSRTRARSRKKSLASLRVREVVLDTIQCCFEQCKSQVGVSEFPWTTEWELLEEP